MPTAEPLPYKIATLVDLRDRAGRVLLLRRVKAPNMGLCSPIGGKLDMASGESPAQCARREAMEEAGVRLPLSRFHLAGLISEAGYEGKGHWLLFYYRVLGAVSVRARTMREGALEWHRQEDIESLPLPETDRRIIWPLVRRHESLAGPDGRGPLFCVHIDCTGKAMRWSVEEGGPPARARRVRSPRRPRV